MLEPHDAGKNIRAAGHKGVLHKKPGRQAHRKVRVCPEPVDEGTQPSGQDTSTQVHVPSLQENAQTSMVRVLPDGAEDTDIPECPSGLAEHHSTESSDRAAPLPVTGLQGSSGSILREHAAGGIALLFDALNGLRDCGERARAESGKALSRKEALQLELAASAAVATLALRIAALQVAKQVNVGVTVTNQSQIPDWEEYPQSFRDEVERQPKRIADIIDVTPET